MIAAVHLDLRFTVPVALALAALIVWYGWQLGDPEVPRGRRWIRRASLLVMLLSLPNFVRGLSVLDPAVDKAPYLLSWTLSILAVLVIFASACLDALYTLQLHRRERARELGAAVDPLAAAARRRDAGGDPPGDPAP